MKYKEDLSCFLFDSLWMSGIFSPRPGIWHCKLQRRTVLFSLRFSLDVRDIFSLSRWLTLKNTKKTFPVYSSILVVFLGYFLLVQNFDFANYKKPFLFSFRFSLDCQDIFSSSRLLTLRTTKNLSCFLFDFL